MNFKWRYIQYLFLILIIYFGIQFFLKHIPTPYQQFTWQTQNFLQGKLDIFTSHDTVFANGKYYWPQGPFPSVLMMPFQFAFGPSFDQVKMQIILILSLTILLYKLARVKKFDVESSSYLTIAFIFASVAIGLILDPRSWFYSQVVTIVLLTAFLYEYETRKRFFLLGILEAGIIATRPTAGFIILLALFTVWKNPDKMERLKKLIYFLSPIAITVILLMWFNLVRFGNPFDNGYLTNNVGEPLNSLRNIGLFSIQHIPQNFYYYFLASVTSVTQNNPHLIFPFFTYHNWGLSLFIVSPFFIFYSLKTLKSENSYLRFLWIILIITLLLLLSYYATGWEQLGPRYSADFLPILYLLTLYSLNTPKLTNGQKNIIIISSLINLYLLFTPFIIYGNR